MPYFETTSKNSQIGMFVRANFVDIYLQGMRDRSMRSGTELAREIKLTDSSMAGNLSNRSSGVQIPRDICSRLKRYLYSAKCSWIISNIFIVIKLIDALFLISGMRFTKMSRSHETLNNYH